MPHPFPLSLKFGTLAGGLGSFPFDDETYLPPSASHGIVSDPIVHVGLSAMMRKHKVDRLENLPIPKSLRDLQTRPYTIAVLRNSRSHLFANVALKRADKELILCETIDEAIERITLSGMNRLAHVLVISAATAILLKEAHSDRVQALFTDRASFLEVSQNCLLARSDWPELLPPVNQSIQYLIRTGALEQLYHKWIPKPLREALLLPGTLS